MSKVFKRTRFVSYGTVLGWLIQSMTMSGATRPGDLDPSFDPGSGVEAGALVVQDDGKLIIGGGFTNYNGTAVANIARLNPDGSLDTNYLGFGVGIGAMQRLADGKIVLGGTFGIRRVNADGTPDASFGPVSVSIPPATTYSVSVNAIHLYQDGRILIGGYFARVNGEIRSNIARLTSAGVLDAGFDPGTGADGRI